MYYILAELTGVVAEILLAHIYFNGFFTKRSHPRWAMVGSYIAFGVILTALGRRDITSFKVLRKRYASSAVWTMA